MYTFQQQQQQQQPIYTNTTEKIYMYKKKPV